MSDHNNRFDNLAFRPRVLFCDEFLKGGSCDPGLAQCCYTATEVPLLADLVCSGTQHSFGGALLVQLTSNVGHTREAGHVETVRGHGSGDTRWRRGDWSRRRRRSSATCILRHHTCGDVELPQFGIAFFLMREQLLNALQALEGLVAHSVLDQNFRLQHQVLQRARAQSLFLNVGARRLCSGCSAEARSDDFVPVLANFSLESRQAFLMSRLVGSARPPEAQ